MPTYYHNLNFGVDLLKSTSCLTDLIKVVNGKKAYHSKVNIEEHINPEMLDFLSELDIFSRHCELFYSESNFTSGIHVDYKHGDFTKINWVFGGTGSTMNWYNPKDNVTRNEQSLSVVNSPYIGYKRTEVDLVFSSTLGFPALVQAGMPHNITNPIEDRYCISLVLSSIKNNEYYRPTMKESMKMLINYLDFSEVMDSTADIDVPSRIPDETIK